MAETKHRKNNKETTSETTTIGKHTWSIFICPAPVFTAVTYRLVATISSAVSQPAPDVARVTLTCVRFTTLDLIGDRNIETETKKEHGYAK